MSEGYAEGRLDDNRTWSYIPGTGTWVDAAPLQPAEQGTAPKQKTSRKRVASQPAAAPKKKGK